MKNLRFDSKLPNQVRKCILESYAFLEKNNIPISSDVYFVITNSCKSLGYCINNKSYYKIGLNTILFNNQIELKQTIIHELLHTIKFLTESENHNHSGAWKKYANKIGELTNNKIKIVDKGMLPNSILDNMKTYERECYVNELMQKYDLTLLKLIPACYYYFDWKKFKEIAYFCITNYDWEDLNDHGDSIKTYLTKEMKKVLMQKYINGDFDNKIKTIKGVFWFEGIFSLTEYFSPVIEHSKRIMKYEG